MKTKITLILVLLLSFQIFAQVPQQIVYYSQNNTGFPVGVTDFTVTQSNEFYIAHVYENKLNKGGVTYFDGTHWQLTQKGDKSFPFENSWKVFYSPVNEDIYVYGSFLRSDDADQQYRLARFDKASDNWVLIGDSASFAKIYSGGLTDVAITPTNEIFACTGSGFFKVEPDTCLRYYPPDNPYFTASKALIKPDGGMYLLRSWIDGWGNSFAGIYSFYGTAPDTIKDPLDSLNYFKDCVLDDFGNLWILGDNFVLKFANGIETKFHISEENSLNTCLAQDGNYLWLGTTNGVLFKFDIHSHELTKYRINNPSSPGTGSYTAYITKIISQGDYLYISFQTGGIAQFSKSSEKIIDYWATSNSGLPGRDHRPVIISMDIDYRGHYWFASLNNGIAMFNGDSWNTFSTEEIGNRIQITTWDMVTDNRGFVYTVGDSLRYWNSSNGWKSLIPPSSIAPYFYGKSLAVDNDNIVWIADEYDGLLKFNPATEEFTKYSATDIGGSNPVKLFIDSHNNLWIGFRDYGVTKFDGNSFTLFTPSEGIQGSYATDISESPDGAVWVSFLHNGLAKYSDGIWTSYTKSNSNLPLDEIRAMTIDLNGEIWIGSNISDTIAVYSSLNGTDWNKTVIDPNNSGAILDLMFDSNSNLFVSADNAGIYVYNPDQIILDVKKKRDEFPNKFMLHQNYPNPFNPTTTIEYSIPVSGSQFLAADVNLTVYDALGKKITTLVNGKKLPGNYSVSFNASNLPSGVYFYRIITNNFVDVKKMVLLK